MESDRARSDVARGMARNTEMATARGFPLRRIHDPSLRMVPQQDVYLPEDLKTLGLLIRDPDGQKLTGEHGTLGSAHGPCGFPWASRSPRFEGFARSRSPRFASRSPK